MSWTSEETETNVEDDGSTETSSRLSVTLVTSPHRQQRVRATAPIKRTVFLLILYLGASVLLTPRVVAGFQVEGALSEMTFGSGVDEGEG